MMLLPTVSRVHRYRKVEFIPGGLDCLYESVSQHISNVLAHSSIPSIPFSFWSWSLDYWFTPCLVSRCLCWSQACPCEAPTWPSSCCCSTGRPSHCSSTSRMTRKSRLWPDFICITRIIVLQHAVIRGHSNSSILALSNFMATSHQVLP